MNWDVIEIDTPHGPARAHRAAGYAGAGPRGTLMLGHGAGGSITAPDLQAVATAVVAAGFDVILVEQPYRVAGRKAAAPAKQLDTAWLAVAAQLGLGAAAAADATTFAAGSTPAATPAPTSAASPPPLFAGGRSSGARVACRTAAQVGAAGVLCLAFPLMTPKGASRQDELDDAGVPVLVVQGMSDRFGQPEPDAERRRTVVQVAGDHGLKRDHDLVAAAVTGWLVTLTA